MNFLSPHKSSLAWWVEVNTSVPRQTYHLGPFKSREEAKISRSAHVDILRQQEGRDILAMIKQR